MNLKLFKLSLCSYVDCSGSDCCECPADERRGKEYFPRDAQKWWEQHWDFTQQKAIPHFQKGELIQVSDDGQHWFAAIFDHFDPDEAGIIASRELRGTFPLLWMHYKPWKPAQ